MFAVPLLTDYDQGPCGMRSQKVQKDTTVPKTQEQRGPLSKNPDGKEGHDQSKRFTSMLR
jgi:hypothetical protein